MGHLETFYVLDAADAREAELMRVIYMELAASDVRFVEVSDEQIGHTAGCVRGDV